MSNLNEGVGFFPALMEPAREGADHLIAHPDMTEWEFPENPGFWVARKEHAPVEGVLTSFEHRESRFVLFQKEEGV